MENNQIMPFDFKGNEVRTMTDENGEPIFVAKDVCDALGIQNSRDAFSRLEEWEQASVKPTVAGLKSDVNLVNEAGLYALMFNSRKEEAREFKKWVTTEVLPSIRKTGSYTLGHPAQMARMMEEVFVRVSRGVSLSPHKRKPGSLLSEAEKDTLDRLADDYWAYAQMAREIGCDPKTVAQYFKQKESEEGEDEN